jgi:O-antigen/teichoic acid export membrane protein
VPLRSVADNNSFATSNAIALAINALLIFTLMPRYGLWGPTLGLVVGQAWTSLYLGRRVLQRYQIPLSELVQWDRLGLAFGASLLSLAALYGSQRYLPHGAASMLAGVGIFAVVYAIAARLLLREEYGYLMRALTRRKAA